MLKKEKQIFGIRSGQEFAALALEVFRFQAANNAVYQQWLDGLRVRTADVHEVEQIPFLPIELFKKYAVVSGAITPDALEFRSSATTGAIRSVHHVLRPDVYRESFNLGFRQFYGEPSDYCWLGLLPGYLDRKDSSLIYMVNELMKQSDHPLNGFHPRVDDTLLKKIRTLTRTGEKVIVLGVSYALLDLAASGVRLTSNFLVMETGGMKGTRKEMLKTELHEQLKNDFGIDRIHSEYGMTELLSQAYSTADGRFKPVPWMKFLIRQVTDPLTIRHDSRTGGINVIDLANIDSCSFIATSDLGRMHHDGTLELMGRYDQSDVRGCNLMMEGI